MLSSVGFATTLQAVPRPRISVSLLYLLLRSLNLSSHCCGDTWQPLSPMTLDIAFHLPFFCIIVKFLLPPPKSAPGSSPV
uniref:Uncharacterized protein n=1 Tax=Arundo donax TaxID=35708 RepID=A0A0A9HR47_ARUDO